MANRTEGAITIDADAERVLAEIADFEAYPEWSGEIRAAKVRERGADGRPVEVYFEVSAGPINAKYVLRYEYLPGHGGVRWTFVEGSPIRDLQGEYLLEQAASSTMVTYRIAIDPGIPLPGFLKRQAERKIIDTALKGLKKRVEARG